MREYGRVKTSLWRSKKFTSLESDDGKLMYLYLHTCPHANSAGCFVLPLMYAAHDLGWPVERVRKAIDTLSKGYLIGYNELESVVQIADFLKHDPPHNEKHVKGIFSILETVPDCAEKLSALKDLQASQYAEKVTAVGKAVDTLSIPYRNPNTYNLLPNSTPLEPPLDDLGKGIEKEDVDDRDEPEPAQPVDEQSDTPKAEKPKQKRATSLPSDWQPTDEDMAFARKEGLSENQIEREAARFRDHWLSTGGQRGRKKDWHATWRNWIRNGADYGLGNKSSGKHEASEDSETVRWRARIKAWKKGYQWQESVWGPKPGEQGCRAPQHLLDEEAA